MLGLTKASEPLWVKYIAAGRRSYHILKVTTFGPLFLIYRASSMIFNFLMLTLTKDFQLF
jgi:hypothetical protein